VIKNGAVCKKNEENPWMVEELEEFLYYCCPECDEKCRAKGPFLQHALCNHPNAVPCLEKYEAMKVEQITITPDESMLFNIKQESKDENQIDQENSCQDMFDYNDDSESELIKSESKSESKNSGFSEETATFSCKHCNENFDEARLLILHISEKHKEDSNVKNLAKKQKNQKTPCGECGKLYSDSGLRAHMIRAHGNRAKTFKCDHCDYRSAMKQTLTSHVRIVHEKEKHQHFCSVCGKKFANRTLAAKHEEVVHFSKEPPEQVDQKQYECNKCGAKQMTDKNYKKHLRIVHGEHPDDSVTCDKCGKSFTNLRRCRDHIKIMHPSADELAKVQCDCEKCFQVFSSALDLNVHLKECLENPPNLTIPILIYFSRLSVKALKKHSAETHEKYLQVCNICQAAFEMYNQLKEHRNTGWDFVKKKISNPSIFCASFSRQKKN
jgi:hypothetical protein